MTAEDLEKEGPPQGMPVEVFRAVLQKMRDDPEAYGPASHIASTGAPQMNPNLDPAMMAEHLVPPPGATAE